MKKANYKLEDYVKRAVINYLIKTAQQPRVPRGDERWFGDTSGTKTETPELPTGQPNTQVPGQDIGAGTPPQSSQVPPVETPPVQPPKTPPEAGTATSPVPPVEPPGQPAEPPTPEGTEPPTPEGTEPVAQEPDIRFYKDPDPNEDYAKRYYQTADLLPELKQLDTQLREDPDTWNKFQGKINKYGTIKQLLPNAEANMGRIREMDPILADALQWAGNVNSGYAQIGQKPDVERKYLQKFWELGAMNYATNGFQIDPNNNKDRIIGRYLGAYQKALGDRQLDPQDFNLVYDNFTEFMGLNPVSENSQNIFEAWWNSENTSPLHKAGLLLGLPMFLVGLTGMLFNGFSVPGVLMTLLGGLGTLYGGRTFMDTLGQQKQQGQYETTVISPYEEMMSQLGIAPIKPPTQAQGQTGSDKDNFFNSSGLGSIKQDIAGYMESIAKAQGNPQAYAQALADAKGGLITRADMLRKFIDEISSNLNGVEKIYMGNTLTRANKELTSILNELNNARDAESLRMVMDRMINSMNNTKQEFINALVINPPKELAGLNQEQIKLKLEEMFENQSLGELLNYMRNRR